MDNLKAKVAATLSPHEKRHKVTVVGSGNWGSAIAKMVAENAAAHPDLFEPEVQMWVYEEEITLSKTSKRYEAESDLSSKPQKLTHLINHFHENVKYLPDIPLPHNLVANPDLVSSVQNSSILVLNLPHQFINGICKQLKGHILPYARGVSCIKGVNVSGEGVSLFSETIGEQLGIYCGALSGANIANEVAQEKFSETTIAYDPPRGDSQAPTPDRSRTTSPTRAQLELTRLNSFEHTDSSGYASKTKLKPLPTGYPPLEHSILKTLFHRPYFHVRMVHDVAGVGLGGGLKNVIAVAADFVDGLGWGNNAKAAVMRVGLLEMVKFGKMFFSNTVHAGTFTEESCGVADLITSCAGGRNYTCAKLSVQRGVSIEQVEKEELNGQMLQGTLTAKEVNSFLKSKDLENEFPLMTATWRILEGKAKPEDIPDMIEGKD